MLWWPQQAGTATSCRSSSCSRRDSSSLGLGSVHLRSGTMHHWLRPSYILQREPFLICRLNINHCSSNENNSKVESLCVVVTGSFSSPEDWIPMENGLSGHATQNSNKLVVNFDNGVYYFELYRDSNLIRSTVELCPCLLVCTGNVQGKFLFRWNSFGGNGSGSSSSRVNSSQQLCLGITK